MPSFFREVEWNSFYFQNGVPRKLENTHLKDNGKWGHNK